MTPDLTEVKPDIQKAGIDWSGALICKSCGMRITHRDWQIEKSGRVEHMQLNPHGITFIFRTFSRAIGVFVSGEATKEFSWFQSYHWQFAHCQGCGVHLGWQFSGDDVFFALLNNKLIKNQPSSED